MTWEAKFSKEWIAVTEELRKHDLSRIALVPAPNDIRAVYHDRYEENARSMMMRSAIALGITIGSFYRKCRRESLFTATERDYISELLNLTEEEIKRYF